MTAIDVAQRFPRTTLAEAWARARETERWVFDGLISSSITTIYGPSNVGKSYIVSSMILGLMLKEREFMGLQPTDPAKGWNPAILTTDPGSAEEYAERICADLVTADEVELGLYHIGMTRTADEWEVLSDHLVESGHNFVVLDNLNGATGDYNDSTYATIVYDGLNRLAMRGVPVVVLHHETGKHKTHRGADPMGTGVPVQKSRCWIQVRQTQRRKLRGGNTGLYVQSNKLPQPMEIIATPLVGPAYHVVSHGPAPDQVTEDGKPKQNRAPETLDRNLEMARHVAGKGLTSRRQAAKEVAAHFDGITESTAQSYLLAAGPVGRLLRDDRGVLVLA